MARPTHDSKARGASLMSKKNKHRDHEAGEGVAVVAYPEEHPPDRHKSKTGGATYSDGHPLDQFHYLEAKLILKPDRFTSVESFRDFGKLVKRTAKNLKVGFTDDPEAGRRPKIREITFGDTPDNRLYNHAFILPRRITYVDGFPVGDPEIVFKFRHPDEQKAAAGRRTATKFPGIPRQIQSPGAARSRTKRGVVLSALCHLRHAPGTA